MLPASFRAPHHRWTPWAVLAITLLLTGAATAFAYWTTVSRDRARFEREAEETGTALRTRLETYVAILRGGVALFAASDAVTRDEFRRYVHHLGLGEHYPGIQGVGFTLRVPPGAEDSIVAEAKRGGLPDYRLWQDGPALERHAIVFLEPLDRRNRAAMGYNMFAEPARRDAMARARDTGQPVATGRVTLVQEIDDQRQSGFLIYIPIYRGGDVPQTLQARREQLLGFMYSAFRADDLLRSIFDESHTPEVDFRLFADSARTAASLLHDSRARSSLPTGREPPSAPPAATGRFRGTATVPVAGRPWGIEFVSSPVFDRRAEPDLAWLILAGGLLVSAILFELSRIQVRAQQRIAAIGAELLRSEQAVQEVHKQESIGLLAGGIAHDFNNLLTGILGNAALALGAMSPRDPARAVLDDVIQAARRAAALTDQLLAYAGKRMLTVRRVDICEVLQDTAALMRPSIPRRVRFEVKLAQGCGVVEADAYHLQQLFVGLLMNAVEAIGDRDGTITLSTDRHTISRSTADVQLPPGAYLAARIEDTGDGMSESTLRQIFDPFFTTNFMGRGLGLAAAQGIVRSHRGAILVRSVEGQGSEFTVLLPVAATSNPADE